MPDFELQPTYEHLTSELVLVQAWKKTHRYIREHNWLEDALELDESSLRLQSLIKTWREELADPDSLTTEPLRLVLAPKSGPWGFKHGSWGPKGGQNKARVRPLAHASLRDQTYAVAVLMCIANIVESSQGNPNVSSHKAREIAMVSYGNRLFCDAATSDRLRFRWGNSELYRRYYQDYRAFLRRPKEVINKEFGHKKSWAHIRTDLSQFFDRVRSADLFSSIRKIVGDQADQPFLQLTRRLFSWGWDERDRKLVGDYARSCEPPIDFESVCLPQGLVASGFLSNVFMRDFDVAMTRLLIEGVSGYRWRIVDYSRYVDDMSLVLDTEASPDPKTIQPEVCELLNRILKEHAPNQLISQKKTKLTLGDDPSKPVPVADLMEIIQATRSGPFDVSTGRETLEMIEGLFSTRSEPELDKADADGMDGTLKDLFAPQLDVGDETVARFSANRWKSMYRTIRPVCPEGEGQYPYLTPSQSFLDHKAEVFSRSLLRRWIEDPSAVRLLRVAFDLVPDPQLMKVVLALLRKHVFTKAHRSGRVRHVCWYVLSELFRAGASETGRVSDPDQLPRGLNIKDYLDELAGFGKELVKSTNKLPWYVQQQALLFLASTDNPVPLHISGSSNGSKDRYRMLHSLLLDVVPPDPLSEVAPMVLILNRITRDSDRAAKLLYGLLERAPTDEVHESLSLVLSEASDVSLSLWAMARRKQQTSWRALYESFGYLVERRFPDQLDYTRGLNGRYGLLDVVRSKSNPLCDEIASLIFLRGLINETTHLHGRTLAPGMIDVECKDWTRLSSPAALEDPAFFKVHLSPAVKPDIRYEVPEWWSESDAFRLQVGQIMRLVLIGQDNDFTKSSSRITQQGSASTYRPTSSGWYKRRFGTFNGRSAIGPDWIPISPWSTELLHRLLAFPGQHVRRGALDLPDPVTRKSLELAITRRFKELMRTFGRASGTPLYRVPVTLSKGEIEGGKLRVAVVQTVLPLSSDFKNDLTLDDPVTRRRHRRHIQSVLVGVKTMLQIRQTHMTNPQSIDLVLFPELAVHPKDIWLIERFVDQAKCIAFCGLVFHPRSTNSEELINSGLWIIPDTRRKTREMLRFEQGKFWLTKDEKSNGIFPFRPSQWVIAYMPRNSQADTKPLFSLSASLCYDATDLSLAADLRNITDAYIVSALNKDIGTFDSMVAALHYHMFQHVILVNSGQYGGSTVQAPFREQFHRTILHHHGNEQVVVSFFEVDLGTYKKRSTSKVKEKTKRLLKVPPAGWRPR